MNRNKINKYIALGLIGLFSCTACTKNFKEYNTNPNNVTLSKLQEDNLYLGSFFVKMIQSVFPFGGTGSASTNAYQVVENLCGDAFGGYNGQTHNWSTSGDQLSYNFSLGWNDAPFNQFYTGVMGNWAIIKQNTEKQYPDLFSVAQIIKIYMAQRTTDTYGPIPYLKAGEGIGAPYDSQQAIYLSMMKELNTAIATLKPYAERGTSLLRLFDDIYGGNYSQWLKLANSLKLRIAMRMAYVDPALAQKSAEEVFADPDGPILNNSDNAIIRGVPGSPRKYNNPLSGLTNDYNEARMSANMESFLVGYNDPRLSRMFYPATKEDDNTHSQARSPIEYLGIRSGLSITDAQSKKYVSFSKLRTDFPISWFCASETWFLRAEAALRSWNVGKDAKTCYENGIKASFEQWKATGVDSYLKDNTSKPAEYNDEANASNSVSGSGVSTITIAWDDNASTEQKLERIITQKWIALYPNGQEAWSEFRRTGYPKLFPVVVNHSASTINTAVQIRRLPYPKNEREKNTANYDAGVKLLNGSDNGGTRLWWDKK